MIAARLAAHSVRREVAVVKRLEDEQLSRAFRLPDLSRQEQRGLYGTDMPNQRAPQR